MEFSTKCNRIFWDTLLAYRKLSNVDAPIVTPHNQGSIESMLTQKNWIDNVQWDLEDIIRDPDIDPKDALLIKRRIDRSNQERTDLVEKIDDYFLERYHDAPVQPNATINTESPAWAVDRLSILSIKIYHMQLQANNPTNNEEHRARCQGKLDILLEQRKDLSTALDQLLEGYSNGTRVMKVYRQMKMYNDPAFNPKLRGQEKR